MNASNKEKRREQIMKAGIKVFSRRGFIGTQMSMVAQEAGISHGLLYNYFKSKDDLFITLVESAMEQSRLTMEYAYQLPGTPFEKIRMLTKTILSEGDSSFFLLIHQARTSEGVPEQAQQLIRQYSISSYVDQLLPLIAEGQQLGEIIDRNPRELITCYLTVISGLMLLSSREDGNFEMPNIDILLRIISVE